MAMPGGGAGRGPARPAARAWACRPVQSAALPPPGAPRPDGVPARAGPGRPSPQVILPQAEEGGAGRPARLPPSTSSTEPLQNEASSDSRKAAAAATSAACP
jgi:hypothetical protein